MDDIAKHNKIRWEALAKAEILYSRPFLDDLPEQAKAFLDRNKLLGNVQGKEVLCLASGGG